MKIYIFVVERNSKICILENTFHSLFLKVFIFASRLQMSNTSDYAMNLYNLIKVDK